MELVQICMFCSVSILVLHAILDKKLVNLWLEHERNVYQVLAQLVKKACGALSLESFELIKIGT